MKFVSCIVFGLFVFHDLLNTGVLSTLSNFQDGALAKIVNDWKSLTIFTKSFTLGAWQDPEYASDEYKVNYVPTFAIC